MLGKSVFKVSFLFFVLTLFMIITPQDSFATVQDVVDAINNYGDGGGTGDPLTAVVEADGTITVTGNVTDATQELNIYIDSDTTIQWNATLVGNTTSDLCVLKVEYYDEDSTGSLTLELADSAKIENITYGVLRIGVPCTLTGGTITGTEYAINVNNNVAVTVKDVIISASRNQSSAISLNPGKSLTIEDSKVTGGLSAIVSDGEVDISIDNSEISTTEDLSAAIYVVDEAARITISDSVITENHIENDEDNWAIYATRSENIELYIKSGEVVINGAVGGDGGSAKSKTLKSLNIEADATLKSGVDHKLTIYSEAVNISGTLKSATDKPLTINADSITVEAGGLLRVDKGDDKELIINTPTLTVEDGGEISNCGTITATTALSNSGIIRTDKTKFQLNSADLADSVNAGNGAIYPAPCTLPTTPNVSAVSSSEQPTKGEFAITFNEKMLTKDNSGNDVGAVSLTPSGGSAQTLAGGWSENDMKYTVEYSGLAKGTEYTLTIAGFKNDLGGGFGNSIETITKKFKTAGFAGGGSTPPASESSDPAPTPDTDTQTPTYTPPPHTPTPKEKEKDDKPAPEVPVLSGFAKSGDTFTFEVFIANANAATAGQTIQVTLNGKYKGTVTIGADGVGRGTIEAPGFIGPDAIFSARVGATGMNVTVPLRVYSYDRLERW